MDVFVPREHPHERKVSKIEGIVLLSAQCIILLLVFYFFYRVGVSFSRFLRAVSNVQTLFVIGLLLFWMILLVLSLLRGERLGLVISNGNLFSQNYFTRKPFDPTKVAAIKVLPAYGLSTGHGLRNHLTTTEHQRDENGKPLYKMFLLGTFRNDRARSEIARYYGSDQLFAAGRFPGRFDVTYTNCLYNCVYYLSVINLIKKMNPVFIVWDPLEATRSGEA